MLRNAKLTMIAQAQDGKIQHYCFLQPVQTYPSASFSVIYSLAAYIVYTYPNLPHPLHPQLQIPHNRYDPQYPSTLLSLHPFFDEWVEVLTGALILGNALRKENTLYLKVKVSKGFAKQLKKKQGPKFIQSKQLSLWELFELKEDQVQVGKRRKKIGWVNCSTSQINRKIFQPSMNVLGILFGQIFNNQEIDIFHVLRDNTPSANDLMNYDTLIIPGSGLSVLSNVEKISKLSQVLLEAYNKSSTLKIMGICYGHQLMAKIFGAQIVKRKRYGGIQNVKFSKQVINKFPFLAPLGGFQKANLYLSEHHEDFVVTQPKGFVTLAVSDSCEKEAFVSEDGRIFSTQFHPQYCYQYTKGFVGRLNVFFTNKFQQKPSYSHEKALLEKHISHCIELRQCISKFI